MSQYPKKSLDDDEKRAAFPSRRRAHRSNEGEDDREVSRPESQTSRGTATTNGSMGDVFTAIANSYQSAPKEGKTLPTPGRVVAESQDGKHLLEKEAGTVTRIPGPPNPKRDAMNMALDDMDQPGALHVIPPPLQAVPTPPTANLHSTARSRSTTTHLSQTSEIQASTQPSTTASLSTTQSLTLPPATDQSLNRGGEIPLQPGAIPINFRPPSNSTIQVGEEALTPSNHTSGQPTRNGDVPLVTATLVSNDQELPSPKPPPPMETVPAVHDRRTCRELLCDTRVLSCLVLLLVLVGGLAGGFVLGGLDNIGEDSITQVPSMVPSAAPTKEPSFAQGTAKPTAMLT